ncbi:alcohol dehydrogenase catalytic domain-containing protein [Neobacillus sp. MM2021_6]|uniref:zinc-dependent alcohol dehydrogenase n=1 Tax=Bacillaceae TaxID=186817 RepID=UPI00140DA930|nr:MULTISPECIES: alcohol dehydrogenase catalytic domain-containing protein [Bacillaceae]MBO0962317.1 alcohol dehydrogenase catalytic domain-containing protein [Neobacillus sp. MM2021_6]NHC20798.1 alcohol dehydrogenase catalytic domain-containing protein [Bacillus sp. MM2020_4]
MGTMKAAVYYGPRDIRVENFTIPEVGPNDILLKVNACGICGSDVHSYGTGLYIEKGQIMGHEFSGEVVKVGALVNDIEVGERGTGFHSGVCGTCFWCKRNEFMHCPNLFKASTGYGLQGAFAEYLVIQNAINGISFHKIPDQLDHFTAATIEPVSVAAYTVDQCQPKKGDNVAVLGAGLIGNACMQVFKSYEVNKVAVSEVSEIRLEMAKSSGADVVINAAKENVIGRIKELYGPGPYHFNEGAMTDIVVEASGAPSAVEDSFELVRSGGVIAFVGLPEKKAQLDTTKIVHKAPKILGVLGGDFHRSIDLLTSQKVQTKHLITHVFPIDHAKEAFETQMRPHESVKVMIEF